MKKNPVNEENDLKRKHVDEKDEEFDLTLSLCVRPKHTASSSHLPPQQPLLPSSSYLPPQQQLLSTTEPEQHAEVVINLNTKNNLESEQRDKVVIDLNTQDDPQPQQHAEVAIDLNTQKDDSPVLFPTAPTAPASGRSRRGSSLGLKSETVPPPFPWATDRRATIYNSQQLMKMGISVITGMVKCKRCEKQFEMRFNLEEKLKELLRFIMRNKATMHDRAPKVWEQPVLPKCVHCGQDNSARPVVDKKKAINWLFLLLGQMLGCCTLEQLKYFCKHTNCHRTGAKNRLLYSTYMGLIKQLEPRGIP
ncbi:hypothetical protein RJT34_08268 [Clitoria ternatea]|uniref:DUF7086 domain-containing protein n=1 Tax=Clitoria ternatea TaxID=43366 RepID=A0AAN9K3K0_CLITE